MTETLQQTIAERSIPEPNSGCWLWERSTSKAGYGNLRHEGKVISAHRASYVAHVEPIPTGMHVLHRCDTPCCVNPDHLFIGTHEDNMSDMASKGRAYAAQGEEHPQAKLSSHDVEVIQARRAAGERLQSIADAFGVCDSHISRICNRKRYYAQKGESDE